MFDLLVIKVCFDLLERLARAAPAVAIQLCIEPFSALTMSFWLSYLSVIAVLFAVNCVQHSRGNWIRKLGTLFKIQLVLTVLIIPISGLFFAGTSLSSILYNLIFIPWFGFVVVPLMFVALIITPFSVHLANMLWQWLDWMLVPLTWSLPFALGVGNLLAHRQRCGCWHWAFVCFRCDF